MELEISPEPSDEERAAIVAALAAVEAEDAPPAIPWRAAGLREATGADDDEA